MRYFLLASFFILFSCAHSQLSRYQGHIEPHVNKSKKNVLNKILGAPTKCAPAKDGLEKCEYRTAIGRNHPVPDAYRKNAAMGPDVSPYEYFDVLHLYYDNFGVLKEWAPIVIR